MGPFFLSSSRRAHLGSPLFFRYPFPPSPPTKFFSRRHFRHTAGHINVRPSPRPTHSSAKPAAWTPFSTRIAWMRSTTPPNRSTNAMSARRSTRRAFTGAGTTLIDGTVTSAIGRCRPRRAGTRGWRNGRSLCRRVRRGRCKSEDSQGRVVLRRRP